MVQGRQWRQDGGPARTVAGRSRYPAGQRAARRRAGEDGDGVPLPHFPYRRSDYRLTRCPLCGEQVYLAQPAGGRPWAEDATQPWAGHGCLAGDTAAAAWDAAGRALLQAGDHLAAAWAFTEAARQDPGPAAAAAVDAVLGMLPGAAAGPDGDAVLEFLTDAAGPDVAGEAALLLGVRREAAGDLVAAARGYARALQDAAFDPGPARLLADLVDAADGLQPAVALGVLRAASTVQDARLRSRAALQTGHVARRTGDDRAAARSYLDTIRIAHPPDALQAAAGLLHLAADAGTAPDVLPDSVPRMILNAGRILARQGQSGRAAALYRLVQAAGAGDTARDAATAAARLPEGDGAPVSVARALAALSGQAP